MSSNTGTRRRPHPAQRFASEVHRFDVHAAGEQLAKELDKDQHGHRQITLYKHGPATLVLFRLRAGGSISDHGAPGVVTIHVLEGRLTVSTDQESYPMGAGQLLVLAPGVRHDVTAEERSLMLLGVFLEQKPAPRRRRPRGS
jgi:quercetin dioxygenase-like cupin family protein